MDDEQWSVSPRHVSKSRTPTVATLQSRTLNFDIRSQREGLDANTSTYLWWWASTERILEGYQGLLAWDPQKTQCRLHWQQGNQPCLSGRCWLWWRYEGSILRPRGQHWGCAKFVAVPVSEITYGTQVVLAYRSVLDAALHHLTCRVCPHLSRAVDHVTNYEALREEWRWERSSLSANRNTCCRHGGLSCWVDIPHSAGINIRRPTHWLWLLNMALEAFDIKSTCIVFIKKLTKRCNGCWSYGFVLSRLLVQVYISLSNKHQQHLLIFFKA